jgi:resuscitation-promoting factor RpfB
MLDDIWVRLYHPQLLIYFFLLGCFPFLTGCTAPEATQGEIEVSISVDGEVIDVLLPAGGTVEEALAAAGVSLNPLDRTNPPSYAVLNAGSSIELVRIEEEYIIEQVVLPYESQIVRNESLPEGEELWVQVGENGLQEITVRRLYENGEEVSSSIIKSVIVKDALPQIRMIGVQRPFTPISIPGRLVYLSDGKAWVMEGTTANRRGVVTTGDLDGRVFSLSPDGEWLLFTRHAADEEDINSLWAASLEGEGGNLVDLQVANVIHFADWKPDSALTVAYSTVEPRDSAPGWQANNDLGLLTFSATGFVRHLPIILEANSGGVYGWWGTTFAWAPDGLRLAYARPDQIGTLELSTGALAPLLDFEPLQTFADWAWVPGITWSPEGSLLYHVSLSMASDVPQFDLAAIRRGGNESVEVAPQVGMFAYPVPSPLRELSSGEASQQIAFLQAIYPNQSESSRYRLAVMDRDGSNQRVLFPTEGASGLEPQRVAWSPDIVESGSGYSLAAVYQNNLWLVDEDRGEAWQITGDGLTSRIDWR